MYHSIGSNGIVAGGCCPSEGGECAEDDELEFHSDSFI